MDHKYIDPSEPLPHRYSKWNIKKPWQKPSFKFKKSLINNPKRPMVFLPDGSVIIQTDSY